MERFFIADTHFDHRKIIEYCSRPFDDIQEMNETIIKNWNEKIRSNDVVYHLGDFAFKNTVYFMNRLNGRIILIPGNHDRDTLKYLHLFEEVSLIKNIKVGKIDIVMCHYAMRVWHKSHFNSWHLYGHSHGSLQPIGKSWDVGVDRNNFKPLAFWELRNIMNDRPDNFNLVHRYRK